MRKWKEPKDDSGNLRHQSERLAYEALRRSGDLVPTAPEDVARIEAKLGSTSEAVPPSLLTPPDLSRPLPPPLRLARNSVHSDTQENLARAAREGKPIPAEVDARMRKDREDAERDAEGT